MGKRVTRRADKKNLITRKFLRLIILIFALSNEKTQKQIVMHPIDNDTGSIDFLRHNMQIHVWRLRLD
jgi:hypothetical protein